MAYLEKGDIHTSVTAFTLYPPHNFLTQISICPMRRKRDHGMM